jgi:carboxyl-terminal processing protease
VHHAPDLTDTPARRTAPLAASLRILSLGLILLLPTGLAVAQEASDAQDPELNFEFVWATLDKHYPMFGTKNVDWMALYDTYRPEITSDTTADELFDITMDMLRHLNDAHVCIQDSTRRICSGFIEELQRGDFSLGLVRSGYLRGEFSSAFDGKFTHGWLTDDIGYVHMADFKKGQEDPTAAIDTIIEQFVDAKAMIVDVRNNPGGHELTTKLVAGRFADRPRHFMRTRVRYGENHDDFGPVVYWNVEPEGPRQFTRPTILLTNRFSGSGADIFALAMSVLPHVTLVGEITGGAFSSQAPVRMPNGWTLWIAFKLIVDLDGVCWDGIGFPPDLRIVNTPADIANDEDKVLEFSMRLIERGDLRLQDEQQSLEDVKTSLVTEFIRAADKEGVPAAQAALDEALAEDDDQTFFSADQAIVTSNDLLNAGRFDEVIVLMKTTRELYPQIVSAYALEALAQMFSGDVDAARAVVAEAEGLDPGLPWEGVMMDSVRSRLDQD